MVVFVVDGSAAQVPPRGRPYQSSINRIVRAYWSLAARESLGIWLERVSFSGNPADAPSKDRPPPAMISGERPFPSLRALPYLLPILNLNCFALRKRHS